MKEARLIFTFLLILFSVMAQAQNLFAVPQYEIISNGIGNEGTFTADVTIYEQKPNKNTDFELRKAAVYGTLFKGIEASDKGKSQKAIATMEIAEKNIVFFSKFFACQGEYTNFASPIDGTLRVEKIGKKKYRIRSAMVIQKDGLRGYLEKKHIIESFNDMF